MFPDQIILNILLDENATGDSFDNQRIMLRPFRPNATSKHIILRSMEETTEIQNESTSFVSAVRHKFAGCCLNAYGRREVRQLRSHVVLPNEKFRLKYLYRNRAHISHKAKETLLLLIFSSFN